MSHKFCKQDTINTSQQHKQQLQHKQQHQRQRHKLEEQSLNENTYRFIRREKRTWIYAVEIKS